MGKKSEAAKNGGKAEVTTESAPERSTTTVEKKVPQFESPQGTSTFVKKVKSLASQSSSKKKVKKFCVRRSERIQNSCTPRNYQIQHVIEEITLSESDEEDELPTTHEKNSPPTNRERVFPELTLGDKNLEGKIDYLVQQLEAQGHIINSLKTEVIKNSFSTETTPAPNVKYKSMYIASQKKIEELVEENRELTQKLENALDQFEAYKKGTRDGFEVLEKLKDVILISNLSRVSEVAQAAHEKAMSPDAGDVPSAKRKKVTRKKLN